MTSDRSAKKAARARMAATGEPYSTARRAMQTGPDRPAPLARPPAIDPREHAVHSRHWGVLACYLVRYEGRYSAWIIGADHGDRSQVYGMPSESAGRAFTDGWQAMNLLHIPWDERIASIFLLSPDTRNGILYEAAVVNVEDSGIWLAGLSRESLGRVLAGQDWTWPQHPVVRPPGSRLADTSATTLATRTVDGHRFDLVSYLDTSGGRCIAIDRDGRRGASACDIQVDEQHLASAAMTMATRGHGTAAIYGRVHASVTELHAVMKNGERVEWPIYDDPRNQERYFAVIADSVDLADIVAAAPAGSTSLKPLFGMWFSQPPGRAPRRSRARSR